MKPKAQYITRSGMWMVHKTDGATGFGYSVAEATKAYFCMSQPKQAPAGGCGREDV